MPAPRKPGRTEAEVQAQVVEAFRMLGIELKRRNVGAMTNPQGRTVRFADPGDADLYGILADGRHVDLEVKREGFDPRTVRGKDRERFQRQLDRLKRTNAQGGVGTWLCDSAQVFHLMSRLAEGWRVEFDADGFPWLTDEPREE
jgi:hypothetical protein